MKSLLQIKTNKIIKIQKHNQTKQMKKTNSPKRRLRRKKLPKKVRKTELSFRRLTMLCQKIFKSAMKGSLRAVLK